MSNEQIESTEELGHPTPSAEQPYTYQPEVLNHNDIINAERIIAIAMERGTFKAKELVEVSAVYARLSAFVESLPEDVRGK